ncbi:hypothetical protein RJ639_013397 [Escallonia herrerae]|uniref:HAT C-terminal dimerisation domain-containing protein n=1 Tax=Escallonia herrerae TaxID=1293975 RepID=A0AA89AMY5_9ASTE|nr:hypothetical protein RJ639_013397 [Escallonia herrerae]
MDILGWWKADNPRFPIFSQIADDALVVPISNTTSWSTLAHGIKKIDQWELFDSYTSSRMCSSLAGHDGATQAYLENMYDFPVPAEQRG